MGLAEIVEHNKLKSGEDQPEAKALHEDYLEVNYFHDILMVLARSFWPTPI